MFSVQDVSHIFSILTRWKIICHTSNGQKGMCICLNTRLNKSEPIILERIYLPKFWLKHNPKKKDSSPSPPPPPLTPIKPMFFLWGIWSWICVSAVIQVCARRSKDKFYLVSPKAIYLCIPYDSKTFCSPGSFCLILSLKVRVFRFLTGKKTRVFDESLQVFTEMQQVIKQNSIL